MRIVVNDIAASKTGALAILMDFYRYVSEHCSEDEWIFLTGIHCIEDPPPFIRVIEMEHVKRSQKDRLIFDLVTGRGFIEALEPDVVFSLQNTLTRGRIRRRSDLVIEGRRLASRSDEVPQVLYVHQPLSFQTAKRFSFFKKEEREYAVYQYLIGALIEASVKRASLCIVQTRWMQQAMVRKTKKPEDRVARILPDVGDLSDHRIIFEDGRPGKWDRKHFFFPSGEILYKNHECVLKAAAILNERGYKDFTVHFTLKGLSDVTDRVYPDPFGNINWSGRVSREEVLEEYGEATLLFPSYIETFGVPLAEARQVGTLILASDCPFSHDVLEGYPNARFFDPFDEGELAELMEQVLTGKLSPVETESLSDSTEAGAEDGSWGETVRLLRAQLST